MSKFAKVCLLVLALATIAAAVVAPNLYVIDVTRYDWRVLGKEYAVEVFRTQYGFPQGAPFSDRVGRLFTVSWQNGRPVSITYGRGWAQFFTDVLPAPYGALPRDDTPRESAWKSITWGPPVKHQLDRLGCPAFSEPGSVRGARWTFTQVRYAPRVVEHELMRGCGLTHSWLPGGRDDIYSATGPGAPPPLFPSFR